MHTIYINLMEEDIVQCLKILNEGGIILYPTDTVWGLGCDATNAEAVDKIFALKNRPANKSLVILVADERAILNYTAGVDLEIFNYLDNITQPTTVIYDNAINLASNVPAADGSVAMRICNETFCKHLIKRFRKPIVSTSANISGIAAPAIFKDISPTIINGVDYVVRYRQDDETIASPSKIIRWNNGEVEVLRK